MSANHWVKLSTSHTLHPSVVKFLNIMEILDIAHGENDNYFDRPTNITCENTLNLFTGE